VTPTIKIFMKIANSNPLAKVPIVVWLGLLSAITLDTIVQMVWKTLVIQIPDGVGLAAAVKIVGAQPYFYYLLILFVMQFFCWMIILGKADLTYVKPFTSLSLVTVSACAAIIFNEHIGAMRIAGIAMIIAGVWLISGTDHKTGTQSVLRDSSSSRGLL
jgi:drug/metabolite transporter (DMT)-like permease